MYPRQTGISENEKVALIKLLLTLNGTLSWDDKRRQYKSADCVTSGLLSETQAKQISDELGKKYGLDSYIVRSNNSPKEFRILIDIEKVDFSTDKLTAVVNQFNETNAKLCSELNKHSDSIREP